MATPPQDRGNTASFVLLFRNREPTEVDHTQAMGEAFHPVSYIVEFHSRFVWTWVIIDDGERDMLQRPIFAYDPQTRTLAMARDSESVGLWRLAELDGKKPEPAGELKTSQGVIVGVALVGDSDLVTIHESGSVVGWEIGSILADEPEIDWEFDTGLFIKDSAQSPCNGGSRTLLALGGKSGELLLGKLGSDGQRHWARSDDAHRDKIEVLAFSENGQQLASSGRDREIVIWSTEFESADESKEEAVLERTKTLTGSGGWPLSLAFSSDSSRLVSGCMDNGVYLWDLTSESPLVATRFEHHGWVEDVEWTDNDEAVLSASWDDTVGVFGASSSLEPTFQFMYHHDYVVRVLPVPDTSLVVAASYDGDVTVWDWRQGRIEAVLEGHSDWVTDLVWLGDATVASLSSDRTARLWSVDDFSARAVLGDSLVGGFELSGGFDLASFGLGERQSQLEDDSGPDLDALQHQVVRRFDSTESLDSSSKAHTAATMLEDAVEKSQGVGGASEFGELDSPAQDSPDSLGNELSDMVWDAISDVEDVDDSFSEMTAEDAGKVAELAAEETSEPEELLDVPEMETASKVTMEGEGEPGSEAVSDSEPADEEDEGSTDEVAELAAEETSEPEELLDVPEMETADKALLDTAQQEPEDEAPKLDLSESSGVSESVAEKELTHKAFDSVEELKQASPEDLGEDESLPDVEWDDDLEAQDEPSIEELEQQEFEDSQPDADRLFQDSVFDTAPPSPESSEERADSEVGAGDSSPVPTSGPLYDPQPIDSEANVDELLPDEDMLDLAFSSSFGEVVEPSEASPSEPTKEDVEPDDVDRDEEDENDASDGERGPPGKPEPSSANDTTKTEAGGGRNEQWKAENAPSTLTRAKPLMSEPSEAGLGEESSSATMETGRPSGERRATTAPGYQMGADHNESNPVPDGNTTLTPFTSEAQTPSSPKVHHPAPAETAEQRGQSVEDENWKPTSVNRGVLQKLARSLKRDSEQEAELAQQCSAEVESPPIRDSKTTPTDSESQVESPELNQFSGKEESPSPSEPSTQSRQESKKKKRSTQVGGRPKPAAESKSQLKSPESNQFSGKEESPSPSESSTQRGKEAKKKKRRTHVGGRPKPEGHPSRKSRGDSTAADEQNDSAPPEPKSASTGPDERPTEKKDQKKPHKGALKLDAQVGKLSLGDEETAGILDSAGGKDRISQDSAGVPDKKAGVLDKLERRLSPGEDVVTDDALQSPESTASPAPEVDQSLPSNMEHLNLRELWQRADAIAPRMGILKRRLSKEHTYEPFHQIRTSHRGDVSLAVSSEHKRMITAGRGGSVEMWNLKRGESSRTLADNGQWVDVGFVDGERFCFGLDKRGRIFLWLLVPPEKTGVSSVYRSVIEDRSIDYRCAQLADGDEPLLLTGSDDGRAHLWALDRGLCTMELAGHRAPVSAVAFGKKGPITAGLDGQIRFWNRQGMQVDQVDSSGEIRDLVATQGKVFWVESSGALRMMEEGAREPVKLQGHHGEGRAVAIRGDGYFVSGGEDGRLLIYSETDGEMKQEIHIPAPIQMVSIRDKILAAACAGAVIFIFRRQRK